MFNKDNPTNANQEVSNNQQSIGSSWERDMLGRIAMASMREQRRARRWRIFFTSLGFLYVGIFFSIITSSDWEQQTIQGPHTAVVDVNGVIAADMEVDADNVIAGLRAAFENEDSAGVILRINSPGGSPVQSSQIYEEMLRLRSKYPEKPLYSVIEDIGASGGYYVAVGAEKIYADKASLVGSIGVRMDGFGFVESMKKLGIERRLVTAGKNKALMDPFSPEDPEHLKHMESVLDQVHQQFIDAVRRERGERIKNQEEMFSGLVWTGEKSVELGLIDALGDMRYVAREVIGQEKLYNYTPQEYLLDWLEGNIGAAFSGMIKEYLSIPRLQ